jgi:hypothetical protein
MRLPQLNSQFEALADRFFHLSWKTSSVPNQGQGRRVVVSDPIEGLETELK